MFIEGKIIYIETQTTVYDSKEMKLIKMQIPGWVQERLEQNMKDDR